MRLPLVVMAILAGSVPAMAEPAQGETVTVGPWQVEAAYKGKAFERCVMSRTTDDGVSVRFVRDAKGMTLAMSSPKWKLGRGRSYPVELVAGSSSLKADVKASVNAVSVPIADDAFLRSLRQGDALDVRGEGSTIHVALVGSDAALDRLDKCLARNAEPAATNPFVAPGRKP